MKKLVLVVLTFLSVGTAYALPLSNPAEAGLYTNGVWRAKSCRTVCDPNFTWMDGSDVRTGFYGDYVFNRKLQCSNVTNNATNEASTTTLFTNAGTLTLNMGDWFDIYGVFGATHIQINSDATLFANPGPIPGAAVVDLNFRSAFSWGAGLRATLWDCRCFAVGIEGQYFQTNTRLDNSWDGISRTYFNSGNRASYWEWQGGLGASYRFIDRCSGISFIPYTGVKLAWAKFGLPNISYTDSAANVFTLRNLYSSKVWGYALGLTTTISHAFGVTIEGRWADESAIYVNSQLRF